MEARAWLRELSRIVEDHEKSFFDLKYRERSCGTMSGNGHMEAMTRVDLAMSHDLASLERVPIPLRPVEPDVGWLETAPFSHLPQALTSLIGRDIEVAAARRMLIDDQVRLLTLTGPGGVGKTRLAMQIGASIPAGAVDGVLFIPLSPLAAPDLVLPTLARALGLRDSLQRPLFAAVVDRLQRQRLLLILDNMEHLREASPLLPALLAACPDLLIVVTSRVLLRLSGEQAFPVPPLSLPRRGAMPRPTRHDLEEIARADAIRLFVARACAVQPSFTLNADNAATIDAVCWHLDGLPLAIELAAARLRVLSPRALLAGLGERLRLLADGPRDVPGRLRTLRDAIAWSVDLLSPEEYALFMRLGVFVDGFTLEAADWVGGRRTGDGSERMTSVLDLVTSLVDQSLVQRVEHDDAVPRYRMLETIRAYALHELADSNQEIMARDAHAAWCLAFAERAEPELSGLQQKAWFDRFEAEHPNMRAALHWFLTQRDAERGLRLASFLTWFWSSRSYFHEARQWLETFLAMPTSEATRGRGLLDASNILHWLGDDANAARCAHDALAIFRQRDDAFLAMCTLRRLGSIAIDQREYAAAAQFLAQSQELLHVVPPPWDPRWDAAFATFLAGRLAAATNQGQEALAHFAEAVAAFTQIGDRGYVAAALGLQGAEWLKQGELDRARDAYATSLDLALELADHTWVAWALLGSAHLAHAAGDIATAARLLGAATAMREAIGERRLPDSALTPALQAAIASDHLAKELAQGASLPTDEAIAMARAILVPGDVLPPSSGSARHLQHTLTVREREVLSLLADGVGDKAIALTLSISRRTASQHVAAILGKLGVESRTAAVSIALRQGLLTPSTPQDRPAPTSL